MYQQALKLNDFKAFFNLSVRGCNFLMRKIIVRRKRQFAAALVPYWIVVGLPRAAFMEKYHLSDDTSCRMAGAYPLPRMDFDPQAYGQPILNGKTLEIEADDDATTVFAVTAEGLLSNELTLDEKEPSCRVLVTTKGGWKRRRIPRSQKCKAYRARYLAFPRLTAFALCVMVDAPTENRVDFSSRKDSFRHASCK